MASLACAGMVHAAGLGRLNVQSRLGQPFAAEIELINVTKDVLATLKVSLAPPAAYQAANLRFDPALNTLRLSVERHANGTPYIRATSAQRVTEPYLDLLVELSSQDGKLQRRYAALLDLPDAAERATVAPPAPVAAAPAPRTEVMSPRMSGASRARPPTVVPRSAPAVVSAPVVAAPAALIPAARAPVTPAAGNNAVAQLEPRPVEPAKSEPLLKPAPPESKPAAAEVLKAEPPEPKAPAPAAEARAPAPKKEIVSSPPPSLPSPPRRGIIDTAMNNLVLLGGIALAGIGGLLWALRRRKYASEPIAPMVNAETLGSEATVGAASAVSAASISAPAAVAAARHEAPPEATVANVTDMVDPLDEAKVFLEYGQDEQAEKILREALSTQPAREDIQKLLQEILALRGDASGDMEQTMVLAKAGTEPAAAAAKPLPDINFELPPASAPLPGDRHEQVTAAPVAEDHTRIDFEVDVSSINRKLEDIPAATAIFANDSLMETVQQKIALARAYREMGDKEGALELLREVEREGNAAQQAEAHKILQTLE